MVPWQFLLYQNNCDKVFYKITEFDKGKIRGKEHNGSQFAKINESGSNLSILDRVRLNNADRLIIDQSLKYKFFKKQVWNAMRNCPG